MPEEIVGLITLFHADVFLPDARRMPYIQRPRAGQNETLRKLEGAGRVSLELDYREGPAIQSGREIKQFRKRYLEGASFAPFLAEPRLIFVPDERPPKAKWKAEFRREWPDENAALLAADEKALVDALGRARLQVVGLWLNPTVDLQKFSRPKWLNMVVSASPARANGPSAPIRFFSRDDELWATWEDVIKDAGEARIGKQTQV